jgi:circadian clock protein KaiB
MQKYLLKLSITGRTARSQRAIDNLRRICEDDLAGRYAMEVIDVLDRPQLAEQVCRLEVAPACCWRDGR